MTIPGQNNYGSGTFIRGDNYGNIEMVDAKTKALLKKMTEQSPDLAQLLTRALNDGVISADMVQDLGYATRNLNEDVALMMARAADNLNEDVAVRFQQAANSLNEDVASSLMCAANDNAKAAQQMEDAASIINSAILRLSDVPFSTNVNRMESVSDSLEGHAQRIQHGVTTSPKPDLYDVFKALGIGLIVGLIFGVIVTAWIMNT